MDKYEFKIKVEQLKKMVGVGDYETAMKIADGIDWRRVKNVALLSTVSDIYEKNAEYTEAKEVLLLAYERAPIGKRLLYKLTRLALLEGNVSEAEAYYREFYDLAPEDARQHILRYLILKAKNASIDQLIHSLETYNHTEHDEKWMYELAELYHKAGMSEQCIKMCDNIMLFFGLGQYVDKAIELKTKGEGQPLTEYQQGLIDNRDQYEERLKEVAEEYDDSDEVAEDEYTDDVEKTKVMPDLTPYISIQDEDVEAEVKVPEVDEEVKAPEVESEETEPEVDEEVKTPEVAPAEETEPEVDEEVKTPEVAPVEEIEHTHSIIEAKTPEEGLEAARNRLKELHDATGSTNKVVKITARGLNEKGVANSAAKMAGKDIIIEEAGDLTAQSVEELMELIDKPDALGAVLFIDNPLQIQGFTEKYPKLAEICGIAYDATKKTESVSSYNKETEDDASDITQYIPVEEIEAAQEPKADKEPAEEEAVHDEAYATEEMDIDDFVEYACKYATEIDCSISGKSKLALYERIEIMEEDHVPLTKKNAEDLIEEAADRAEKPSLGKKLTGLFSAKYDKDGMLILKEEHFIS